MKKADLEKEEKFVEHYTNTGNAKESAIASGYNSKSACSMGHYLKKKFALEIEERQKEKLQGMSGKSLGVLDRLLKADSDNVKLNACKLILECNGFTKDSNLNVKINDKFANKSDEELIEELKILLGKVPTLKEKFN